ncbi:MAG: flagellar basal body P-ring formation chaperone FlgA, partial [Myxococcota bacterium]
MHEHTHHTLLLGIALWMAAWAISIPGTAQAQPGKLIFFARSEVLGDVIRVDDVARIQGVHDPQLKERLRAITLGRAPEPSRDRSLSRLSIESALKQGGLPETVKVVYPSRMVVHRPGQKVQRSAVGRHMHQAIVTWVEARVPKGYTIEVEPVTWRSDLMLPKGQITYTAQARDPSKLSGTVMFTIDIAIDDHTHEMRHVSARLRVNGPVCTLSRDLRAGEVITDRDVIEERGELKPGSITCAKAVGLSARSSLRTGSALRESSLKAPDVVKRGDQVVIEYISGALRVTGVGEARKDGAVGE